MADKTKCVMLHFNPRDVRSNLYGWFKHKTQVCEYNEKCEDCPILRNDKRKRDQREKEWGEGNAY